MRIRTTLIAFTIVNLLASGIALAGGDEDRYEARLSAFAAGDVSGKVDYENRIDDRRQKFSVEVEGLGANQMYDVMVAGTVVGTVMTDATGLGEIDLDTNFAGEVNDLPMPENFPAINGGELVEVGPLRGNLQPN